MTQNERTPAGRAGFSLVAVSVLLTVGALVMVSMLPGNEAGDVNRKTIVNIKKLEAVERAMESFMVTRGRRPCPADGQYDPSSARLGIEAADPGPGTRGTPSAPFGPDAGTGFVVGGTIPTKSLHLPDEYAFDEWGRQFTYVVDVRATLTSTCRALEVDPVARTGRGGVVIHDAGGATTDEVMYAYLTHGPDGHGAFPAGGSGVAGRYDAGSTDADTLVNAGVDAAFAYSATNFANVKVRKDKTATFDDVVYFRPDLKNTCCLGSICQPRGFRIDGEAAGFKLGLSSLAVADLNDDGIDDLAVNSPGDYGRAYVISGHAGTWDSPFLVTSLDGTNGFRINYRNWWCADCMRYWFGTHDMDGDGKTDLLFFSGQRTFTILFADSSTAWPASLDNNNLDGPTPFLDGTNGVSYYLYPTSLGYGDFNGDGKQDIAIGRDSCNHVFYVWLGPGARPWPAANYFGPWGDPSQSVTLDWSEQPDGGWCEIPIATGDYNGDGITDLASSYSNAGDPGIAARVVFGGAAMTANSSYDLADLNAGGNPAGVSVYRAGWPSGYQYTRLAGTVRLAGGKDSLLIADGGNGYSAQYYGFGMALLNKAVWPATIGGVGWDPTSTLTGADGFAMLGDRNDSPGGGPVGAADLNGDGNDDVLWWMDWSQWPPNRDGMRIMYSGGGPFNGSYLIDDDAAYSYLYGPLDRLLAVGDVNADGYNDLVLSDVTVAGNAGRVYVVFGAAAPFRLDVTTDLDGLNGFTLEGVAANDNLGLTGTVADLNGNGKKDLVVCAPYADNNGADSGSCYVVYGHSGTWPAAIDAGDL